MTGISAALQVLSWLIAASWAVKVVAAARGLPQVPNLLVPGYDRQPAGLPRITVIVPARNEAANIRACIDSLLAQDYAALHIIAVDDRSSDTTGIILDELAAARLSQLQAMRITHLPPNWLGKTHAMAAAAQLAIETQQPDFLLFTDADILYRPDALRRALVEATRSEADHLVLMPTFLVRRWDEAVILGFFQILGLWGPRPWRVANPRAMRDAIGVGAFNMVRTTAYEALGGFEAQPMAILEDLTLGRRVKLASLRQRMAFGRGLVSVHWAAGALGVVGVMTKNIFSLFNFHASLLLVACLWMALFCLGPVAALAYAPTRLPGLLALAAVVAGYRLYSRRSGIAVWTAALFPFGALLFLYALVRSMAVTLARGGVTWRGTFYPLADLRRNTQIPRQVRSTKE
jgi:GT2 family glycosyltransferase